MSGVILPFRGHTPKIHPDAWIASNAVIIGQVTVEANANIWYGCVLRGDIGTIHVGEGANIQDGTIVHVTGKKFDTWIGKNATIGHMVLLHGCRLEDRAFVGMKACVMDGTVVETGGWVAAGAVLTPGKRVLSGQLWAGSPAKYLRDVKPEEDRLSYSIAAHYAELAKEYPS